MRDCLKRPADLGARCGGEEFAIILPDTDEDGAYHVAEDLRRRVRAMAVAHEAGPHGVVTVSVGLALAETQHGVSTPEGLISRADRAPYDAKGAGRDRVMGWRDRMMPVSA